ncbi:hypothetical protein CK203_044193 [Vitis vinifera]|uniref:Uncharacterized protein n=1 Tax=Vitis vinifera TaxID=29760 RepID=A0A438I2P5_VITVI|nr:hypothetical protein CK203_044193 [Vitis vinifera]
MSPKPTIFNPFITLVRYPALHPYLHLHLIANVGSDGGGAPVSTAAPTVAGASIAAAAPIVEEKKDRWVTGPVGPTSGWHPTEVAPPPVTVPTPTSEDPYAGMDWLEQGLRQLRTSDKAITWEDFDGVPVASLPANTIMRAHGLDGAQMIMFFPMSLGGTAQRWRELEALRQRTDESVSSFISRWHGKIVEIIDRPPERDRVQMVLRSLQLRVTRHVVGVPFADFGSLVLALYDVEDSISRGLWTDSSPNDIKGKKPFVGQRSVDVSAIGSSSQRPLRRHQPIPQLSEPHSSYASHQYRPRAPRPAYDQTYTPQTLALPYYASQDIERPSVSYTATGQPCYTAQFTARPAAPYPRPRAQQTSAPFALRTHRFALCIPSGAWTRDRSMHRFEACCQDLIDQGLVHLGQPSVTTNPLPAHTTHVVPPPIDGIHFLDFDEIDDHIHMLSDDNSDPEPIMLDVIYEMSGVTLGPRMPAPFRLVPKWRQCKLPPLSH